MPIAIGSQPLLGPVVGLASWTLIMEAWMYALRIPAITKYKLDVSPATMKEEMDKKLPPHVKWPADNYNHLMEQPTQFFATVLALNALGADDKLTVGLAWGYVGIRVVHSVVQAVANPIMVRFSLFGASSVVLAGLTVKAVQLVWGNGLTGGHFEL